MVGSFICSELFLILIDQRLFIMSGCGQVMKEVLEPTEFFFQIFFSKFFVKIFCQNSYNHEKNPAWGARNTRVSRMRNPRNKCRKNFEKNFDKKIWKRNLEKNSKKKF